MELQSPAVVTCTIGTLEGNQYSVEVKADCNMWNLRQHLSDVFGIPEYEQLFARGSVQLKSNDLVCFAGPDHQGDVFELTLLRFPKPACFTRSRAEDIWQAFLSFSPDNGDTVDSRYASKIARFAGMYRVARAIQKEVGMPTHFTYPDLMQYLSALKIPKSRATQSPRDRAECQEVMRFDVGRTQCARLQEQDFSQRQADEAESNEGATDSDETTSETDSD
eukprot:TRINITY_DN14331_c0_g2_i1.p1 TRINITY_DN14331_c0_g2~~TRINITY_DN14331_c0_g2_i1.p1  ORF type:complete len:221 (-),score=33.49 TRINITY_DN14331_c0_g2_i1:48-710(-)